MPEIRERWVSRPAFVMAAIGSAVGLGNLWRFPYIAAKNGGGAFLIPYFIAVLTTGIPLMILEYGLGQAMQGAAPAAFKKLHRKFEWVGWFALAISSVIVIYYAAVMAWSCRYLWASITREWGDTHESVAAFFGKVIERTDAPSDIWGLSVPLLIGLALTWAAIYWIIHRGVHRVGRIVMITVPLPVILILVLVARGITLPNADVGLNYYLNPTWDKLVEAETWLAAYAQVFFSLSVGFGILIAYASYMPKKQDVSNNAFITSFANALVSYLAGFAVFSVLGYFAVATNQGIEDAAAKGPGLAFVVYPEAINHLPDVIGPYTRNIFGVLFFITLLSLGIDSAFSLVEAVVSGVHDKWPAVRRSTLTGIICTGCFVLGLLFITDAGLLWLDIVDHWCLEYGLVTVGLLECVVIGWLIRTRLLTDSINEGAEVRVGVWWSASIKVITPVILTTLLVVNFIGELKKAYGPTDDTSYPMWALIVGGWAMIGAAFIVSMLLMRTKELEVAE